MNIRDEPKRIGLKENQTFLKINVLATGVPPISPITNDNNLQTLFPELAKQWDYDRNVNLLPINVTSHSGKSVWWLCKEGHSWNAPVYSRANGNGCPYCAGKRPIKGKTDLLTLNPVLAEEWDYTKNNGVAPSDVTCKSGKKVWWKCVHGHNWQESVRNRSGGYGCPYCSGKRIIKGKTDLMTLNPALAKEWDYSKNKGFTPSDVKVGSHKSVWWRCKVGHSWEATIINRTKGSGCPYCAGQRPIIGKTDLQTNAPELAKEWDYAKNQGLTPSDVTTSSGKSVWWRCKEGHSWRAIIANRSKKGVGCPLCSGRLVVSNKNDLLTLNPTLVQEWDYDKNKGLTPSDFTVRSGKKVWWKCNSGHSWLASITNRFRGGTCPICSGKRKELKDKC